MSSYGKLERKCAHLLEKMPFIKKGIKRLYTSVNYAVFRSRKKTILNEKYQLTRVSPSKCQTFFGYYDRNPINADGNAVYYGIPAGATPFKCSEIDVFYNETKISSTTTWNYQQGALMSWIDKTTIIHNIFENGSYMSKIVNVTTGKSRTIDYPVYSVAGNYALSLNFTRLAKYRNEYGYYNLPYNKELPSDTSDGVYLIDIEKNSSKLLISIEQLKNNKPNSSMVNAKHKVNHLQFAPDGKNFIFHHRWYDEKGIKYSRLYYSDIDTGNLTLLADGGMISHCNFRNNKSVIGWMRLNDIDGYYLIDTDTLKYTLIGKGILKEDGHPSFDSTGNLMLTDTYPDRSGMQKLLIFDVTEEKVVFNGAFFSPLKYREDKRCDLHPRWDPDFKGVTFDSTYTGKRCLHRIRGI